MNKRAPAAAVIVCTWNRASLLSENIASILRQDADDWEAVYVNDGSTDNTAAVLAEAVADHPDRIRCITTENRGPGPARNRGVQAVRADYILFLDDDATAPPGWIRGMLAARERRQARALCGGILPHRIETPAERYLHYRMQTTLGPRPKILRGAPAGNLLVERALFEAVGGFPELRLPAGEDWALSQRIRAAGARIHYDPAAPVVHRYDRDLERVRAVVRRMGAAGVDLQRLAGRPPAPYVALSTLRSIAAPATIPLHYPPDLYLTALRMEWAFARGRLAAYFAASAGADASDASDPNA